MQQVIQGFNDKSIQEGTLKKMNELFGNIRILQKGKSTKIEEAFNVETALKRIRGSHTNPQIGGLSALRDVSALPTSGALRVAPPPTTLQEQKPLLSKSTSNPALRCFNFDVAKQKLAKQKASSTPPKPQQEQHFPPR